MGTGRTSALVGRDNFARIMYAMPQKPESVTVAATTADRLADLVRRKQSLLAELLGVCRRQAELVDAGDVEGLLELLAWKQRHLQEVQRLESELEPYRTEDPASRVWRSEELRQETAGRLQNCRCLLADILEIEHYCERRMTARREEISRRLRAVQDAAIARQAYARQGVSDAGPDLAWEG